MNRTAVARELLKLAKSLVADKLPWDDWTERHFQRWLDHNVGYADDEDYAKKRQKLHDAIVRLVEEDPSLMDTMGWPELERAVEHRR